MITREPVNTFPRWCDYCRQLYTACRRTKGPHYCSGQCRIYAWRDRKRQGAAPPAPPTEAVAESGRLVDLL